MLFVFDTKECRPNHGFDRQIERTLRLLPDTAFDLRLTLATLDSSQVLYRYRDRQRLINDLARVIIEDGKRRAQGFVARDCLAQTALQRGDIQRTRDTPSDRHVVEIGRASCRE